MLSINEKFSICKQGKIADGYYWDWALGWDSIDIKNEDGDSVGRWDLNTREAFMEPEYEESAFESIPGNVVEKSREAAEVMAGYEKAAWDAVENGCMEILDGLKNSGLKTFKTWRQMRPDLDIDAVIDNVTDWVLRSVIFSLFKGPADDLELACREYNNHDVWYMARQTVEDVFFETWDAQAVSINYDSKKSGYGDDPRK